MRVAPSRSAASRASITTSACDLKPKSGVSHCLPEDERQPCHLALGIEARHRQRAVRQQRHVGRAVVRVVAAVGDEAIDILAAPVIAAIDDDAAVLVDHALRALMAEAAERGVLHRNGGRIEWIDLHDPAEAVRLVRLLVDIEAVVEFAPGLPEARNAVTGVALGLVAAEALGAGASRHAMVRPEIAVEVLFRGEVGAPRRLAAGAIVERAEDGLARRVGAGLEPRIARRRTVDLHLGVAWADAAVIGAVEHDAPILAFARDLDDAHAMRRHLDVDELRRHVLEAGGVLALADAWEHHLFVGVFVIDAEEAALAAVIEREEGDIVVVVAELLQLRGSALRRRIEGR